MCQHRRLQENYKQTDKSNATEAKTAEEQGQAGPTG